MSVRRIELGRDEKLKNFIMRLAIVDIPFYPFAFYIILGLDESWEIICCVMLIISSLLSWLLLYHSLSKRLPNEIDVDCSNGFVEWPAPTSPFARSFYEEYMVNNIIHIPFSDFENARKTALGNISVKLRNGKALYFYSKASAAEEFIECYELWKNKGLRIVEIPTHKLRIEIGILGFSFFFSALFSYLLYIYGIGSLLILIIPLVFFGLPYLLHVISRAPEKVVIDFQSNILRWEIKPHGFPDETLLEKKFIHKNEMQIPLNEIESIEYSLGGIKLILRRDYFFWLSPTSKHTYNKLVEYLPLMKRGGNA
ncbi:MAG: hypothetical protein QXQ54_04785 [Thermoplasmata archaeon]